MILGKICTRNCTYCNIQHGQPQPLDNKEPQRILKAIQELKIKHAVITCVTRDDLEDGGAQEFAKVITAIKTNTKATVEVLISDLKGNTKALQTIINAKPDIINHNIEVVKRLFPELRPEGNYNTSLTLLKTIKTTSIQTKSGMMLGLGETEEEIKQTLQDLKAAGCTSITLGQYLQPSPSHAEVKKHYTNEEFNKFKAYAKSLGFIHIESGKLVRSSYHAAMAIT